VRKFRPQIGKFESYRLTTEIHADALVASTSGGLTVLAGRIWRSMLDIIMGARSRDCDIYVSSLIIMIT